MGSRGDKTTTREHSNTKQRKGSKGKAQKTNNRKRQGKQKKANDGLHGTISLPRMKVSPTKAQCRQKRIRRTKKRECEADGSKEETNAKRTARKKRARRDRIGKWGREEGFQQGLETQALHGCTHTHKQSELLPHRFGASELTSPLFFVRSSFSLSHTRTQRSLPLSLSPLCFFLPPLTLPTSPPSAPLVRHGANFECCPKAFAESGRKEREGYGSTRKKRDERY